jgi:hypothetical protein
MAAEQFLRHPPVSQLVWIDHAHHQCWPSVWHSGRVGVALPQPRLGDLHHDALRWAGLGELLRNDAESGDDQHPGRRGLQNSSDYGHRRGGLPKAGRREQELMAGSARGKEASDKVPLMGAEHRGGDQISHLHLPRARFRGAYRAASCGPR